jgi:hypothetical protein
VLDAVRTPLAFGDFAKDGRSLTKKLINNAVFSFRFKVLESMLRIPSARFEVRQSYMRYLDDE